jgi:hypothetical protein
MGTTLVALSHAITPREGKKKPRRHIATGVQFLGSQDFVENAGSLLFVRLFSQCQF